MLLGFLTIAVLGMLPLYLYSPGAPQVVDLPILIVFCMTIFTTRDTIENTDIQKCLFLFLPFLIWVCLVNSISYLFYQRTWSIMSIIACSYGFVLMFSFEKTFGEIIKNDRLKYIYAGLILSIALCLTGKGFSEEGRAVLSFNDPNQLGYFAAILLSYIVLLTQFREKMNISGGLYNLFSAIFIIISHGLLLLSLSRSAMAAFVVLDICLLKNIKNKQRLVLTLLAIIMAVVFLFVIRPDFIQERLSFASDRYSQKAMDKSFKERFWEPLEVMKGIEIIVGRGAWSGKAVFEQRGRSSLFQSNEPDLEVHNIFGDVLRSYGVIGLLLLLYWFGRLR